MKKVKGLFRTSKYGKWQPFIVVVKDPAAKRYDLTKQLVPLIKESEFWTDEDKSKPIVEFRF